ncbi:hypothetical protein NFI96_002374, partial [Prochilodus magdalenae]
GNPSGYIWVQTSKSWFDAQTYCRANYTDLASIRSPWEQKQVTSLVAKGVSVWVGLFLDTWQWSDQWSLLYRHWAAAEDRMKKKQIIRVTVSSKADPNVPSTKDTILKETAGTP